MNRYLQEQAKDAISRAPAHDSQGKTFNLEPGTWGHVLSPGQGDSRERLALHPSQGFGWDLHVSIMDRSHSTMEWGRCTPRQDK